MDPLVITATPNICWLSPETSYPQDAEEMAEEAALCREAGASVLHMHADGQWVPYIRAVQDRTDLVVQCGLSSLSIKARMDVFTEGSDEISIMLGHHDEAFVGLDVYELHPRQELADYCSLGVTYGVRPEFEVWNTGHCWNLNWLIEQGATRPPHIVTLFFGWPGGQWTPPTIREYLYRREYLPQESAVTVSTMGAGQMEIMAAAISRGDHIRVGTEDYAVDYAGRPAATHDLVRQASVLAASMGREVATPALAKEIRGVDGRRRGGKN